MNTPNLDALLAEAADKMKREAYAAGWRDAIAAISKAAVGMAAPKMPKNLDLTGVLSLTADAAGTKALQGNLPAQGSTPWFVIQAVRTKPGMAGSEIVAAVKDGGHNASENSIRTSIFRMKDRKFIVSRHGKWFPA